MLGTIIQPDQCEVPSGYQTGYIAIGASSCAEDIVGGPEQVHLNNGIVHALMLWTEGPSSGVKDLGVVGVHKIRVATLNARLHQSRIRRNEPSGLRGMEGKYHLFLEPRDLDFFSAVWTMYSMSLSDKNGFAFFTKKSV